MNEQLTVSFTPEQFNVIAAGLGELPFKVAQPVVLHLQAAVEAHQSAQAPCVVGATPLEVAAVTKGPTLVK